MLTEEQQDKYLELSDAAYQARMDTKYFYLELKKNSPMLSVIRYVEINTIEGVSQIEMPD